MAQHSAAGTVIDVSGDKSVKKLQAKAVGLIGVLFLTVTGAAPVSAMLGNVPFAAGYGIGIHTPAAFLLATIVLTIFSIGYAAMAGRVSSVGGFYAFISQGLGREIGMSSGIASLACYSVFEASLTGLFAFFANQFFNTYFGINIGWLWFALFMIVLTGLLSYREVKLSAQILGAALLLEIFILALFALGIMFTSQPTNFTGEALNLFNVAVPVAEQKVGDLAIPAGAAAVGIFMAFWSWVGFEMAPNYAEESRDPKHIIPRSLYISVIGLGLFYIIVSWCAVSAYPTEGDMLAKAFSDSGNFYMTPLESIYGAWAKVLLGILILTSSFACGMAFHNTASRYMYSLAREGVLPSSIAETHDHHKSPHKASVVQSVLAALWVILFAIFNGTGDPNAQAYLGVYTLFAVLGTGLLLVIQAIVSLAIWNWFRKNGGGNILTTVIAPLFSFLVQLWLVYLLVANLGTFAGTSGFANAIPYVALAILLFGLAWGFFLKSSKPEAYKNIGHMVNEG
ncbi:MAG: APC family permease [Rhizobiales bacterium]|nr:APC family permease [Hyphomicrobiales bacterium]